MVHSAFERRILEPCGNVLFALITVAFTSCAPAAFAQDHAKTVRIGFLSAYSAEGGKALFGCFKSALGDLGWIEGRNVSYEARWAGGKDDQYPILAKELVGMNLDLLAVNSTPATQAMRDATAQRNTPVVFMSVSDPVASGIVSSLARPSGNITGVSNFFPATSSKMLEILKMIRPQLSRVAVIRDPANAGKTLDVNAIKAAGEKAGIAVRDVGVRNASEIEQQFAKFREEAIDGVAVLVDGVTLSNKTLIIKLTDEARLPAVYQIRDFVEAGGLSSYGLKFCRHFARAATYVDKVLRGTKPADLPVELPTTFELLVNAKAAKRLGVQIPPILLTGADEIME